MYIYIYIYYCEWLCWQCSPSEPQSTANLRTKIMDFIGFDSSKILIWRGGILRSIGNFPESSSQTILVGIIFVGRLGVVSPSNAHTPLFMEWERGVWKGQPGCKQQVGCWSSWTHIVQSVLRQLLTTAVELVSGVGTARAHRPSDLNLDRHRLNGYLAQWVPSPRGKHTFKNFTIQAHPEAACMKNTRYLLG